MSESNVSETVVEAKPQSVEPESKNEVVASADTRLADLFSDKVQLSLGVFFTSALTLWFLLDHSWPYWDGASHVLDSIAYRELFRHAHLLSLSWWHDVLTVNFCYAPQLHAWFGFMKLFFGPGLFSEHLTQVAFCLILCFSVYGIAMQVLKNRAAALSAVIAVNCFPLVMTMSHMTYLDYGYLALYSLSIYFLNRFMTAPSWKSSIVLGIALGVAVSSKQVASYFLVLPCIYAGIRALWLRRWQELAQLSLAGGIATSFVLVWILPNWEAIGAFTKMLKSQVGERTLWQTLVRNGSAFYASLPGMFSGPLLVAATASAIFFWKRNFSDLLLVWLSALGAVLFAATSNANPESRYIIPVCLLAALLVGNLSSRLISSRMHLLKLGGYGLLAYSVILFFAFSFTPYPVAKPDWLAQLPQSLGVKEGGENSFSPVYHPTRPGDIWGQEWVIDKVSSLGGGAGGWLCVFPNNPHFNVHTFSLIAHLKNASTIRPTTLRVWSLKGDIVSNDESALANYDWLLFNPRDGVDSLAARDTTEVKGTRAALDELEDRVRNGQQFQPVAETKVADGSRLVLYRKVL